MSKAVFILLFCVCLVGSNVFILQPVLTTIAADFGDTLTQVSRAMAFYGAGTAVAALWLGRLLDGFGPVRALKLSMVLAGFVQILSSQTGGWLSLTLLQVLAGGAAGVALPAIYAITADISEPGREAKTLGTVILGWSISMVVAVPTGAIIADLFGWRWMIALIGGLYFCGLIGVRGFSDPDKPPEQTRPMGRFEPLKLPNGTQTYAICFLFMASFYGLFSFAGAYVVEGLGRTVAEAGYVSLFYGLGFGAGTLCTGILDRFVALNTLIIGLLVGSVGMALVGFAPGFEIFLLTMGIVGFVNSFNLNMIVSRVTHLAPKSKGATLGLYSAVTYIAATFAILTYGQIYLLWGFSALAFCGVLLHLVASFLARSKNPLQE